MPRLFVAIEIPDWAKEELARLCSFGLRGVKWVNPEQFHLSLRFIGEVDNTTLETVSDALSRIRGNVFDLNLAQVGTFPESKSPRIIWAGATKTEDLNRLQKKVEAQLNKAGLKGEQRKFNPHITLGRVKAKQVGRLGEFLVQNSLYKSEVFQIDSFSLFSSTLNPQGAIYRKEKEYQLL